MVTPWCVRLVCGLSIPEQTKQFVFAIYVPESQSIVYLLAAQKLSEKGALDAERLIHEVRPHAIVAQVTPSVLADILADESRSSDNLVKSIPTTSSGVLKGCIMGKLNKETYENVAGNLVLREIFGWAFTGITCMSPKNVDSVSLKRFCLFNDLQSEMVQSVSSCLAQSDLKLATASELEIGEKMLLNAERGEVVYARLLSEVRTFRLAVEGIALNNASHSPIGKLRGIASMGFSKLPMSKKSHVLLAQAIGSRTKDFKSIVAVVEASS
ncbi:hypothetical protein Acr_02g0007890 [Actinidia rufa]|uniref:Uncharacterized protein n=1 Tax=Actinidia rufa TaxID=165716 RepID=A0A7J0E9G4_9ERIC|nr:hypothetical protein Acr_02g0007890 [Actinidia rufa]